MKKTMMKNSNIIGIFVCAILLFACSTSKDKIAQSPTSSESRNTNISLEDRLRQTSGVFFHGSQVRIRGGDQSFFADSEPLFEINGQAITGGFAAAKNLVNPVEIKSIRVLKNPTDLAMYGVRGSNGVIKIRLRDSKGEN